MVVLMKWLPKAKTVPDFLNVFTVFFAKHLPMLVLQILFHFFPDNFITMRKYEKNNRCLQRFYQSEQDVQVLLKNPILKELCIAITTNNER
jgi:hypothetical protein